MKNLVLITSVIMAVALSCVAPAEAKKGVKLGLYDAGGLQQICLLQDGTWYSPTFADWEGKWFFENYPGDRFDLMGNHNSGVENDSLTVSGTTLIWNEWNDGFNFVTHLHTTFTFLGKNCAAPLPKNTVNKTEHPAG